MIVEVHRITHASLSKGLITKQKKNKKIHQISTTSNKKILLKSRNPQSLRHSEQKILSKLLLGTKYCIISAFETLASTNFIIKYGHYMAFWRLLFSTNNKIQTQLMNSMLQAHYTKHTLIIPKILKFLESHKITKFIKILRIINQTLKYLRFANHKNVNFNWNSCTFIENLTFSIKYHREVKTMSWLMQFLVL